ncbi:hypothetical protein [Frankia sp. QA3]|uniref:hypothetical protein n=1 Tax=Frankia sp. QA3 TaxID=710111 RepID=UPI000269BEFA|nr:hypothetical protein [Frankia sp. QA3]EIV92710.1 hypothetical protein FraQA3DRAFT_2320 [Frankia sp. QA3]
MRSDGNPRVFRSGAWLVVELHDPTGTAIARRRAHNAVLAGGAQLVADLFRGTVGAGPVNRMTVGADPAPEVPPFATTELSPSAPDTGELTGPRDVELAPEAFTVALDAERRRILVTARAVLPAGDPGTALRGPVAEAALLHHAEDGTRRLYNRVAFEPVVKRPEQELSLYWEVAFPFGDPD